MGTSSQEQVVTEENDSGSQAFQIRPKPDQQARPTVIKQMIRQVLNDKLSGVQYSEQQAQTLCKSISDELQRRVHELQLDRYKFITHTSIGEQRGSGIKAGAKCLWDSDTDKYVSDVFISETLFCVTTIFLVYYY